MINTGPVIRVVDDNETLRHALEFMLRCEGYTVRAFGSAEDFLRDDIPSEPGCLILDVQMPGLSGLELFEVLRMRGYKVPIIFLTAHADVDMAVEAMRSGACDFYQKSVVPEKVLPAVARAVEKNPAAGVKDLMRDVEAYKTLTEREEQILRLVSIGLVNRRIAERLKISQRTVEHYRAGAMHKLGLTSSAQIAGFFERIDQWKEAAHAKAIAGL